MKTSIIREAGFEEALLGISLSYNSGGDMKVVADKLVKRGGSHSKFLESIAVWLDIEAPRYWWQQFATYRIGTSAQSESTMHTLLDGELTEDNFSCEVHDVYLDIINAVIKAGDLAHAKGLLPESFLQRRIVCTNYMALKRMIQQRRHHKLIEWQIFCTQVVIQAEHPEFLEVTK